MGYGIKIYHDATWNNKTVALVQIDGMIMSSNVADFVRDIKLVPNDHIVVELRSTGGDIDAAFTIRAALLSTHKKITTICYGYTASAATIIAQAASGGARLMCGNALYMIHECTADMEDMTVDELEHETQKLRNHNNTIADIYVRNGSFNADYYRRLMAENGGRGRWLDLNGAMEACLVDNIAPTYVLAETRKPSFKKRLKQALKIILG